MFAHPILHRTGLSSSEEDEADKDMTMLFVVSTGGAIPGESSLSMLADAKLLSPSEPLEEEG